MNRRYSRSLLSLSILTSPTGVRAATLDSSVLHETREYDVHLPASTPLLTPHGRRDDLPHLGQEGVP